MSQLQNSDIYKDITAYAPGTYPLPSLDDFDKKAEEYAKLTPNDKLGRFNTAFHVTATEIPVGLDLIALLKGADTKAKAGDGIITPFNEDKAIADLKALRDDVNSLLSLHGKSGTKARVFDADIANLKNPLQWGSIQQDVTATGTIKGDEGFNRSYNDTLDLKPMYKQSPDFDFKTQLGYKKAFDPTNKLLAQIGNAINDIYEKGKDKITSVLTLKGTQFNTLTELWTALAFPKAPFI